MEINEKNITIVIGPNGSGKTTLLNCISGFYKPTSGKVYYNDIDITGQPQHVISNHGIMRTSQIPAPLRNLTVLENMLVSYPYNRGEKFSLALFKSAWIDDEKEAVKKADEVIKMLELENLRDTLTYKLSGGQLKLLEIGRSLMNDAKMLLLDEPVGSVNPILAHSIFSHLIKLKEAGITALIVEHRLKIALQYVDYVYAMHLGRVLSQGTPEEIVKDDAVMKSYLGIRNA
ncbi:Lipopolysaccharide export system ATP-binding protein LptB [subsurface metagenome]